MSDESNPDDEHFLAIGRAVYAFQTVEWLAIWVLCFLRKEYPPEFDHMTFGRLQDEIEVASDIGEQDRQNLATWARSLHSVNTLRQDIFHWHPVERAKFVRHRPKTGEYITIDTARLDAATHRFDHAAEEGTKVWYNTWPEYFERD